MSSTSGVTVPGFRCLVSRRQSATDTRPPNDEINDVLRRLAASLLADMPRDGAKSPSTAIGSATAGLDAD
jgi:hypothetical protein